MKFRAASLVELHAFLGVCKAGSMRQAADQLCVTQAAISRAILRLEARVGCLLFERNAQGVVPNAQARILRARIEPSLIELERAFTDFGRTHTRQHTLRMSVVPTLGTRWLMPRLRLFQALHPEIHVELRQLRHTEDFSREDIDIWIDIKRPGRRWPRGISAKYLLGRDITAVCAPSLGAKLNTPNDLLKETLLHHSNFPDNWLLWLNAANVNTNQLKIGSGFDLAHNLIVAACSGMGAAVLQPCLIEQELASGELIQPFMTMASTGRGYYLCTRKATDGKSAIEVFTRWIMDASKADAV